MFEINEITDLGKTAKRLGLFERISIENLELWSAGHGFVYMYINDWEYAKALKKLSGSLITYEFRGKVVGWQVLLTSNQLRQFRLQIHQKIPVENKQLTAA